VTLQALAKSPVFGLLVSNIQRQAACIYRMLETHNETWKWRANKEQKSALLFVFPSVFA